MLQTRLQHPMPKHVYLERANTSIPIVPCTRGRSSCRWTGPSSDPSGVGRQFIFDNCLRPIGTLQTQDTLMYEYTMKKTPMEANEKGRLIARQALIAETEKLLESWKHPDPYLPPTAPGGMSWSCLPITGCPAYNIPRLEVRTKPGVANSGS